MSNSADYPEGYLLVGREIEADWNDGLRYKAVVVAYSAAYDLYRVVYTGDHKVEIVNLKDIKYHVLELRETWHGTNVGRIIEFCYPHDGKNYKAVVYREDSAKGRLFVAYLDYAETDNLVGGGWEFLTVSPCVKEGRGRRRQGETTAWYAKMSDEKHGAGFDTN